MRFHVHEIAVLLAYRIKIRLLFRYVLDEVFLLFEFFVARYAEKHGEEKHARRTAVYGEYDVDYKRDITRDEVYAHQIQRDIHEKPDGYKHGDLRIVYVYRPVLSDAAAKQQKAYAVYKIHAQKVQ